MPEHFPDDRERFERHPDVRGLEGPERFVHPHIDEGFSTDLDILAAPRELLHLDSVAVGSTLVVTVFDDNGKEQELSFRREPRPRRGPGWSIVQGITADEAGKLAEVHGSGLAYTSMIRLHQVCEGLSLVYITVDMLLVRSSDELPEDAVWKEMISPIGEMSPERIAANVEHGFIEYDAERDAYWKVPYAIEKVSGPINGARVLPPK